MVVAEVLTALGVSGALQSAVELGLTGLGIYKGVEMIQGSLKPKTA